MTVFARARLPLVGPPGRARFRLHTIGAESGAEEITPAGRAR
jgi:hypothetical protein